MFLDKHGNMWKQIFQGMCLRYPEAESIIFLLDMY